MDLRNTPFLQGFLGATSPAGYQSLALQQQQLQALEAARQREQQIAQMQLAQRQAEFMQRSAIDQQRFGLDQQAEARLLAGQQFDMERMQARQAADEAGMRALLQQQMQPGMPMSSQMGPPSPTPAQFAVDPSQVANASPAVQQAIIQRMAQQQRGTKFEAAIALLARNNIPADSPEGRAILMANQAGDFGVEMPATAMNQAAGLRNEAQHQGLNMQLERLDLMEKDIRDSLFKVSGTGVAFNTEGVRLNPFAQQLGFAVIDDMPKAMAVMNYISAMRQELMQQAGIVLPSMPTPPGLMGIGGPMGQQQYGVPDASIAGQPGQAPAPVGAGGPQSREERKRNALEQIGANLRERQNWYSNTQ